MTGFCCITNQKESYSTTWELVFKIILAAVFSAGGIGAIIIACVKWCSNLLAEKMLSKYQTKLNKDIEKYKHDLELETEKYRVKSEQLTYVTQKQFDTEFDAYRAIFECLSSLHSCAVVIYAACSPLQLTAKEKRHFS